MEKFNESLDIIETTVTSSQLVRIARKTQKLPKADLIISIGTLAAKTLLTLDDQTPVLFTLITEDTYNELLERFADNLATRKSFSAIFINLPVEKHLSFIASAIPDAKTVGIILGSKSRKLEEIATIGKHYFGIKLEVFAIQDKKELYRQLPDLLRKIDVLLSLPDRDLFDKQSIRHILISAFRQRKPIIGYSDAYVKAGALMAMFATTDNMGKQAAEIVLSAFKSNTPVLPAARHPGYTTIEINYLVSQSLGLKIRSKEEVIRKMKSNGTIH